MLAALPGIREIRAALAGGYLWIVFFWLLLDPLLGRGDFNADPYESARHLGDAVGPFALSVAATFLAYLIGTLFNEMRDFVGRLYLRARQSGSSPSTAEERDMAFEEILARNRKTRESLNRRWSDLGIVISGDGDLSDPGVTRVTFLRRLTALIEQMALLFGTAASAVARFSVEALMSAMLTIFNLQERAMIGIARRVMAIRSEPYGPFLSPIGVRAVERYLARSLPSPPGAGEPQVADVISDFAVIRSRLVHHSLDTVNEVDRLNAEADFRTAIVPPLAAIVAVFGFEVSPIWLAAWPLLLAFLARARERRRDAGDLLADALVQKMVKAPSVEVFNAQMRGELVSRPGAPAAS